MFYEAVKQKTDEIEGRSKVIQIIKEYRVLNRPNK